MIVALITLVFVVIAGIVVMLAMGKYAEGRLRSFELQDQHARQFYKRARKLIDAGCLSEGQIERLVFLAREMADPKAPHRFFRALNAINGSVSSKSPKHSDDEKLAKDPDNFREYAEALGAAFLAISYSNLFWGLGLRTKLAEALNDGPRMARATGKVAKAVGKFELQAA